MKNCQKCNEPLYHSAKNPVCISCRKAAVCKCGNKRDFRAKQCRKCDSARSSKSAKIQWQTMRPQMEAKLRAFAATRKGKPIKEKSYCTVKDCNEVAEAHGWCHKHYARWKHHGTTTLQMPTTEQRFWAYVRKTRGCWLWTGPVNEHGYGLLGIEGRSVRAHRYSYFLHYGEWPLPQGRHTCDKPACVRPDHIVAGSQRENMLDMVQRGRQTLGSRNPRAKLTENTVREIKRLIREGTLMQKDIAGRFSLDQSTISDIKHGRSWKHVA